MNAFPKWLIILFFSLLAIAVIWIFSNIFICILLAGVFSLTTKPLFNVYRKIKIGQYQLPVTGAAVMTIITLLIFFSTIFALLIPLVLQQGNAISNIDLDVVLSDLRQPIARLELFLHRYNIIESDTQSLRNYIEEHLNKIIVAINISSVIKAVLQTTGNFFFYTFSSIFILFFFLRDENLFLRMIMIFIPDNQEQKLTVTLFKVRNMLFRYFMAIVVQFTLIAMYVTLLLMIFGVKNALLIGLLAGLLNIIPYLGPSIGLVLAIIIGTIAHLQTGIYDEIPMLILKICGTFMSMQFLDNNFLQPYIFSKSTDAHPLEIFIVIIAAATIGGVGAMIIAVPAYTIIRISIAEFFGDSPFVRKIKGKSSVSADNITNE
jgi:predicted PurR-regulated permease PerM